MITHVDFDSGNTFASKDVTLPRVIESISFSHDGGRVTICVNGEEVYSAMTGTRDCNILIDDK